MKLLLFILGISLCAALPSVRNLQELEIVPEATEEVDEVPIQIESDFQFVSEDDGIAGWLFDGIISTEEEAFWQNTEAEEFLPENFEEFFPGEGTEASLLEQVREDYYLNEMFEFGLDAVISAGIEKSKIPNVAFIPSEISEYSMATNDNGDYVSFNCQAVSENGASVITMTFTVYFSYRQEQIILSTYSYVIRTSTSAANPTTDTYVELTEAQIGTSEEVQNVVAYGNAQIIQKGNEKGKIPVSVYDLTDIISVARMRSSGKTYYKCSVELEDALGVKVSAQYVVSLTTETGEMLLTSWAYNVTNIKFTIDNSSFTDVNKTEAQNNTQIALCLDYAIKNTVKQPEQYPKVDINSVSTQTLNGVVYYKFDVKLDNNNGKTVNLIATVSYRPETGIMNVKSYETRTTTVTTRK